MFGMPVPGRGSAVRGGGFRSNPRGRHPSLLFRHVCDRQSPFFRRRFASDHRLRGRQYGLRCQRAPDYDALFRKIGIRVLQLTWIVDGRWQDSGSRVCASASGTNGAQLLHFIRARVLYLLVGTSFRPVVVDVSIRLREKSQDCHAGQND